MITDDKTMAYAYVAVKNCGCTVACTIDTPDNQRYIPDDLEEFAKGGYSIERVLLSVARERLGRCMCDELTKKEG